MIHNLKLDEKYWYEVKTGLKTFEVRFNDRGFMTGDTVILSKFDTITQTLCTKEEPMEFRVGTVTEFKQKKDFVVFSLIEKNKWQW